GAVVGVLEPLDGAGVLEVPQRLDGGQAADGVAFGAGGLHEDLHDVVLFLRRAAVRLRLLKLAEGPGPLIAAGALAEHGQGIGVAEDEGDAVVAAHVVPELGSAAEGAAERAEQQYERERDEPDANERARLADHRRSPLPAEAQPPLIRRSFPSGRRRGVAFPGRILFRIGRGYSIAAERQQEQNYAERNAAHPVASAWRSRPFLGWLLPLRFDRPARAAASASALHCTPGREWARRPWGFL